jgi:hypothetical protein
MRKAQKHEPARRMPRWLAILLVVSFLLAAYLPVLLVLFQLSVE